MKSNSIMLWTILRTQNDLWLVEFTDAQGNKKQELYENLMVASHHWMPKYPCISR
jgi:hypothetical protein